MALVQAPLDAPLAERLSRAPGAGVTLYWLGQAGFVIDAQERRIVIDPYLSDTLAQKYRGTPHSHARMAPPPVRAEQLGSVDLVLCTHHHTDHMDGETLQRLAVRQPALKFVVPAASAFLASQRIGVGLDRLIQVDAGQNLDFSGFGLRVMRAAHETLERDVDGHHRFLGYGLDFGTARVFHSGDTIPFSGQSEEIATFAPDLALLPVNGRSEALKTAGFAGNFSLAEAISLCERCGIAAMIAHHFGMFAFNTLAPDAIDAVSRTTASVNVVRARQDMEFRLDAA